MQPRVQTVQSQACRWLAPMLLLLLPLASLAQPYSYDGNRWIEAEVVVFRHVAALQAVSEAPADAPAGASFTTLRALTPAWQSYQLDFDALFPAPFTEQDNVARNSEPDAPAPFGPQYRPPVARSFRVADLSRDPFIALDTRAVQMTRDLQRLRNSPDHEVLWHSVWRMPLQGLAQTPAIRIGELDEFQNADLEGGLRLADSNGRVGMDLRLWLADARFTATGSPQGWWLSAQRDLQAGEYYYFDNPAFGVLLQVRRYELPALETGTVEEDF